MILPGADKADIPHEKLYGYLLSRAHPVGRYKAAFFARLGYFSDTWQGLAADLRAQHLTQTAELVETTPFGDKYAIRAMLKGPIGHPTPVVSIWFIPRGGESPRFFTAYPGGRT